MIWILILTLAVIQGFTELLPISSSGHLVVCETIFHTLWPSVSLGESQNSLVTITLHFGTLLAIVLFFRDRVWRLFKGDYRLLGLLLVGSIPAVIVGVVIIFAVGDQFLHSPELAGFGFLATGAILWFGSRTDQSAADSKGLRCEEMSISAAVKIGLAQALAILPGISRSGSTIVAGLHLGLRREESAVFSFLLAIPVIVGGMILEIPDLIHLANGSAATLSADKITVEFLPLMVGMIVSAIVAYIALIWLIRWIRGGKLFWFTWYVVPLGIAVLIWRLVVHLG